MAVVVLQDIKILGKGIVTSGTREISAQMRDLFLAGLVEASAFNRLVMEPFEFVSQVQNAALEISYHQVIRRRTGQSLSDLLFEGFLPAFKIGNMIRFRHGSSGWKEQSGRATRR